MEYKYGKLENIFIEYIISLIGPNTENEIERLEKLNIMKQIIQNSLILENNIIPHIFCFGSFPMKTYLPDSDLDITIILEDKNSNCINNKYTYDYLNKILTIIQHSLENYNDDSGFSPITEVSLIMADVKLIKCKFENLSFDISINNFMGLCKLILINTFERLLINPNLFKRSLFLIKTWCYYEGSLLGSNLGLLASYALEILVMYIFNKFNNVIKTEIDALCLFFEKLDEIKWEKEILSILGKISVEDFNEEAKISNFPLENLQKNLIDKNEVIEFENLRNLSSFFEKFADLDRIQNFNSNKKIFLTKYMNIIDPMFNNNNLGKSVNLHNYNKFIKVIEYGLKDIKILREMRITNASPDSYLNQLLRIFEKTITYNTPELFCINLPQPKIFICPNNFYNNLNFSEININQNNFSGKIINNKNSQNSNSENYIQKKAEMQSLLVSFNKLLLELESNTETEKEKYLEAAEKLKNEKELGNFRNGELLEDKKDKGNEEIIKPQHNNFIEYKTDFKSPLIDFLWPNKMEIGNQIEINTIIQNFNDISNKNLITREILEFFVENIDKYNNYKFSTINEINQIEEFLKFCKFVE